jgi:hypothetical protein
MAKIISGEFGRTRCYTEEEYALLKAEQQKRFKETYNLTSIFRFVSGLVIFCEVWIILFL